MGTYASYSDVQPRVAGRTLGASSNPTSTQVNAWVDEAESMLTGMLKSIGCATPITDADGVKIMRAWVCDYAEGHCRQAWVAAGGDGNDDGTAILDRFFRLLDDISQNPSRYEAMLSGGGAGETSRRVRSHVLDNEDGLTIADGDFAPKFTMDTDAEF